MCYFKFYQLMGWEHLFVSYHWSKDEQMLYLSLLKIAADMLK